MASLSLPDYFDRIGYRGPVDVSLSTLGAIVRKQVEAIPFENLDVLLGLPVLVEPEAVVEKLIARRRGGYCFELNTLLLEALSQIGFDVTPLSARVRLESPPEHTPPRTHLLLFVELDGECWLVDAGIGGLSPTAPLRLAPEAVQPTPHEPRRLLFLGAWQGLSLRDPRARIIHQAYFDEQWHDVYEFTLEPMPLIDRQVANWYTSKHPSSHFRKRLLVARATEHGRITLLNTTLTHRVGSRSEKRELADHDQLLTVLRESFGLEVPPEARLRLDFGPEGLSLMSR